LLETFISIFIGKTHWNNPSFQKNASPFDIAKSLLNQSPNGSTPSFSSMFIHSQFSFLDGKLIDIAKLAELWRNKQMII